MSAGAPETPLPGLSGRGPAKLISCILPDDGTERRLLRWLRDEQGITRANSVYCRGHSVLREAKARRGRLPEPVLMRLVSIVVEAREADALFDRISLLSGDLREQIQLHGVFALRRRDGVVVKQLNQWRLFEQG
jgi:hypothetical protein